MYDQVKKLGYLMASFSKTSGLPSVEEMEEVLQQIPKPQKSKKQEVGKFNPLDRPLSWSSPISLGDDPSSRTIDLTFGPGLI